MGQGTRRQELKRRRKRKEERDRTRRREVAAKFGLSTKTQKKRPPARTAAKAASTASTGRGTTPIAWP